MSPDDFVMPSFALLLAPLVPQALGRGVSAAFEGHPAVSNVRAAALWPCLTWVALISFWAVRWIGPGLVETPSAPPSLGFGALVGLLAGASAYRATAALPTRRVSGPPIGAASGAIVAALMLVASVLLHQRTDLRLEDALKPAFDDESVAAQVASIERRATIDPWDPEVYLARASIAIRGNHLALAREDQALARRTGAAAAPLHALEADTLAAEGRCDEARVAYDAWQRARTADAMTTHFGHELEVLVEPEEDLSAPAKYFSDCDHGHYYYVGE